MRKLTGSTSLAIDSQTIFGMPPLEVVRLAGDLGCGHISGTLSPVPWNPCDFPSWSLREDQKLRRELRAAMADTGVSIYLAEGFVVRAGKDVRDLAEDLDIMQELGAVKVSTVCMEPDLPRGLEQLGLLAEMAGARDMGLTLEFAPPHPISNLGMALDAIRHTGRNNVQLVVDAMHFFRSGGSVDELAALDPGLIGYVQLCDAPLVAVCDDYLQEACFHRLAPGDGQLPLKEFVAALPENQVVGLEVPNVDAAEAGRLKSFIGHVVAGARHLLSAQAASGFR